ncbi:hypothetical protein OG806_02245 [Streptomyces sp. NBC_00882]|uniref:hypothetical protein n=1 Tax=Streptomyces sp. NBC_00882 TaxID=2975856 RepID=UPI0038677D2C|nr:hypothetical protein OG806_02245 [Streptomyces sp. NBC_00882]
MLTDIESGHIDAILARHPDRLYRQPAQLEGLILVIEANDVKVKTFTSGDLDVRLVTEQRSGTAPYLDCAGAEGHREQLPLRAVHTEPAEDLRRLPGSGHCRSPSTGRRPVRMTADPRRLSMRSSANL